MLKGLSKVSEILNGKRKADIPFLKGIHKLLKIDAAFLLEKARWLEGPNGANFIGKKFI